MERLEKWKTAILEWLRKHPFISAFVFALLLTVLVPISLIRECLKGAWEGLRDSWEVEREGIRELWDYIRKLWKMTKAPPVFRHLSAEHLQSFFQPRVAT